MSDRVPPTIFSPQRRAAVRRRRSALQARPDAPRYLVDDMVEDILDRLDFLRHEPKTALVVGDGAGRLRTALDCRVDEPGPEFDEEMPCPSGGYGFIASLGRLDTVNDLPGALIHVRNALAPGGLMIAQFLGSGSLPNLRAAMLAADGERPAARLHPMVDVRAGGQLLQRCGFKDPVVDSRSLEVRFSSLGSLVNDLRVQGLTNVLASPAPPLTRAAIARAEAEFGSGTVETFEILTLSGWRPD